MRMITVVYRNVCIGCLGQRVQKICTSLFLPASWEKDWIMYELQRQSMEIKRTQQDISSLKKQLSELRGLFKGKERKSLEGKIELLEDLEKRLHKGLEQIVKREGYPNVQAFQKVYNKAEELIIEYNEELRVWKNQTEQKKERPLEQPKKASVLEKLHRYQQEGRQQPKRSVKKKSMDRER